MKAVPITRRTWLAGAATVPLPIAARDRRGQPPEIASQLPAARLFGQATLRFLGMPIYDIRLWSAATGNDDIERQPLALELEYARALKGRRIAERSIDEMRRVGQPSPDQAAVWLTELTRLLPDVAAGDRLTGVRAASKALFFHNGRALGAVDDPEFCRLFFGIWLAPATSEPALRGQLLQLDRNTTR